jgi:hypothetical protein
MVFQVKVRMIPAQAATIQDSGMPEERRKFWMRLIHEMKRRPVKCGKTGIERGYMHLA